MARPLRRVARLAGWWLAGVLGAQITYLLTLLAAASRAEEAPTAAWPDGPLTVLVPAHDEQEAVGDCVLSLLAARHPPDRRVVVIADNCTDETAGRARAAGAEVWKREDPELRGKGHALAWALERVADGGWVVFVDADCVASEDLLEALGRRVAAGADGVQADYVVANPGASTAAALRYAGFALANTVRPRGKDALGLSCGLFGSGMAFPLGTLRRVPWNAFSVTEDREYHLRLVAAGLRVRFAGDGRVASPMPTTAAQETSQHLRWETGNARLARVWAPRLLRGRRRDQIHAGFELLIPALSVHAALVPVVGACGVAARSLGLRRAALALGAGQAVYVLGGLRAAGAPSFVYRALAAAPLLVARKLAQYARIGTGRGSGAWERTPRA